MYIYMYTRRTASMTRYALEICFGVIIYIYIYIYIWIYTCICIHRHTYICISICIQREAYGLTDEVRNVDLQKQRNTALTLAHAQTILYKKLSQPIGEPARLSPCEAHP